MSETLAALERHHIFAVTSGPLSRVRAWRSAAPARIVAAYAFRVERTPERLKNDGHMRVSRLIA